MLGGFGLTGLRLGDTWQWKNGNWTQLHPTASPGLRSYGSMIYDRDLHKLVLFGGSTQDSDPGTTWTWNGTNWRRVG